MPERDKDEPFSNPLPPADIRRMSEESDASLTHMTNADFRKLLMTPRATPGEAPPSKVKHDKELPRDYNEADDPRALRRKKKSFYAKLKKQEMEREAELAKKYRNRAQERREGKNDYEDTEVVSTTANYRAVAPDAQAGDTASNRRKQLIEESKYLGGDMEHTHLVKGLDYALLHKVRAEITTKEKEREDLMESSYQNSSKNQKLVEPEESMQFKTKTARNIYRTLFKTKLPERNELFLPGRMAYKVELEDEYMESDIPTTVIRSKADCPTMESQTTLTTNDIVINKLTQILSYLRQGQRGKKLKKKDKGKGKEEKLDKEKLGGADDSIFADIGEYAPSFTKARPTTKDRENKDRERDRERERDRDRDRDRDKDRDRDRHRDRERGRDRDRQREEERRSRNYFERPKVDDEPAPVPKRSSTAKDFAQVINDKYGKVEPRQEERFAGTMTAVDMAASQAKDKERGIAFKGEDRQRSKGTKNDFVDSYAECYPGAAETADALDDSDDEVDYSKMDLGNKKGPVGRWDFDTQEEYSTYMNNKEALPKAAFQFGIKMSDGRKTRRTFGEKNEKAELDREWQQISQIISKRKAGPEGGSGTKRPKY